MLHLHQMEFVWQNYDRKFLLYKEEATAKITQKYE